MASKRGRQPLAATSVLGLCLQVNLLTHPQFCRRFLLLLLASGEVAAWAEQLCLFTVVLSTYLWAGGLLFGDAELHHLPDAAPGGGEEKMVLPLLHHHTAGLPDD